MLSVLTRVALALAALIVIDSLRFADPDLFVTLYAGREIAVHHGPPGVDTASFSVPGQPWNDYEWLARWTAYEIVRVAGDRGLVMARLAIVAAILATLLAVSVKARGGVWSFCAAVALWTAAAGSYLLFRPTLVTFLAIALLLATIDRWRYGARWPLWAIPAAIPLWANFHAGFALGVVLLGLLVAVGLFERFVPAAGRLFAPGVPWTQSLPCFAASVLLTGVHPLGYRQWGAVLGTIGGRFTPSLSEWRPLVEFGFREQVPVYLTIAVLMAAVFAGRRRITAFDVASVLMLGGAAFVRVRFVPLFALAAALVLVSALPAIGETAPVRRLRGLSGTRPHAWGAAGLLVSVVALCGAAIGFCPWDLRIRKVPYLAPVAAVSFLEANGIGGRVFTEYDWGGYVRWKIPDASIFVDGRSDTVYPLPVIEDWANVVNALGDWRAILDRYDAQVIVLRRDQAVVPFLENDAAWIPAFGDPFASVFVRKDPEHAALIETLRDGRAVVPAVRPEDYLGL